jgi:AcrR family transcriptional regulator
MRVHITGLPVARSHGRTGFREGELSVSSEEAKRQQILDAAGRAFGLYGFRKTSVADIVREAGVARATVYNHFATKEDIFEAVVEREVSDIIRKVGDAVREESTTLERLRAAVITHVEEIRNKVNVFRITMASLNEVLPRTHEAAKAMTEEILEVYRWILTEGVRAGEIGVEDVEATAWTILLAFKGVFITTVSGHIEERIPGVVDRLLEVIWDGLRPREGTR